VIRRTSINLDVDLVAEAKRVLGTTETTETVHRALREVIRQQRLRSLVARRFELEPEARGWLRRPTAEVRAAAGRSGVGAR